MQALRTVHILIIPSWYRASKQDTQGSFFREQAFALSKTGISCADAQVGIIHPQHRSMRQWKSVVTGRYGFELENDEANGQRIPTLRMHTMTWFPRQIPYLNYLLWVRNGLKLYRRYVQQYGKPDVIHAHGMMYGGLLAWNIQSRYDVPFVITEHGTAYARNLFAPWELKVAAKAAAAANARLAVSEAFCDELTQFLGGKWQPCPNVVSSLFTDCPLPQPSANAADSPSFVFTTVAYLSVRKGIHHIITAFAKAFGDDESVCLKIGGDGNQRAPLEQLAASLGVAERVIFLGALDRFEVRDCMAQSDAFVLASRYETFGVVVIEALALGKPVIATRCGGPNQVVRPEDGLMIEPNDTEGLAAAMTAIKANYDRYNPQALRAACIARYGEAALIHRLRTIYDEVCAPPLESKTTVSESAAHYA